MALQPESGPKTLESAILRTTAYADVFDYPLTLVEIHRYLESIPADLPAVRMAVDGLLQTGSLQHQDGYLMLPGRQAIVARRQERTAWCAQLWPKARYYGRLISRLPYVRMLAVTGALAMDNEAGRDIDYLVVTSPGRVWLCRALVILVVRWAARQGDIVCPNYLISENALAFSARNLYTAHELAQMTPLFNLDLYWKIRQANPWLGDFLPNAGGLPRPDISPIPPLAFRTPQRLAEGVLSTPPGDWLESWEMQRKQRKFARLFPPSREANFGPEWCQGHFGEYGQKTLAALTLKMGIDE